MRIIVTEHARKRMKDFRQQGIQTGDILEAASLIPGRIPTATRFRGFLSGAGKTFDVVVKDSLRGRLVITVIGR